VARVCVRNVPHHPRQLQAHSLTHVVKPQRRDEDSVARTQEARDPAGVRARESGKAREVGFVNVGDA
jgi:hypothetical protein